MIKSILTLLKAARLIDEPFWELIRLGSHAPRRDPEPGEEAEEFIRLISPHVDEAYPVWDKRIHGVAIGFKLDGEWFVWTAQED